MTLKLYSHNRLYSRTKGAVTGQKETNLPKKDDHAKSENPPTCDINQQKFDICDKHGKHVTCVPAISYDHIIQKSKLFLVQIQMEIADLQNHCGSKGSRYVKRIS